MLEAITTPTISPLFFVAATVVSYYLGCIAKNREIHERSHPYYFLPARDNPDEVLLDFRRYKNRVNSDLQEIEELVSKINPEKSFFQLMIPMSVINEGSVVYLPHKINNKLKNRKDVSSTKGLGKDAKED